MSDDLVVGTITVTKVMTEDDVIVTVDTVDSSGEEMALIDAIGMLEFAKSTLLHARCCDPEAH